MSLPKSLAAAAVDKPRSDWSSFGDPASLRLRVLCFADREAQEAAFTEAGIVAPGIISLPPDFFWPGIGDISIIGKVVDQPAVMGPDGPDGFPTIVQEATFLPGWYVNVLVPEPLPDPIPGAEMPPETPDSKFVDGAVFLARVTDQEYSAVMAAAEQNAQIARWIDILRMRGVIDVKGATAQAAKAGLVQYGLLSAARADVIFS